MLDRSLTKNEIRDYLVRYATEHGADLSPSRADKLANKYKKGSFDPTLALLLTYADPTGERASRLATALDPKGLAAKARNAARLALAA